MVFFCGSNCNIGTTPYASLIQGPDGVFYGTTQTGGSTASNEVEGYGTIFAITPYDSPKTLYEFCSAGSNPCSSGSLPVSAPTYGQDGYLYGVAQGGGTSAEGNDGTIFKQSSYNNTSVFNVLHEFCPEPGCSDGSSPIGSLIEGSDGNFYGSTAGGGNTISAGTLFKITPGGKLTTLYSFCGTDNCTDGWNPHGTLVQGSDGSFYGTTYFGGGGSCLDGCGTAFKVTSTGQFISLHEFCTLESCLDGFYPNAGLVEGSDGNFYGTATGGGANNVGTIFKITPAGVLTTLHAFCSVGGLDCTDGDNAYGSLILGSDGKLYGTTGSGIDPLGCGGSECGTIFTVTYDGSFQTIYTFNCNDQSPCNSPYGPEAGLIQGGDGNFYGTTLYGGYGGTAYKLAVSPPLSPPVLLSFSKSNTEPGSSVTLTWKVSNAFSKTLQLCNAFTEPYSQDAGSWIGPQTGSVVDGVFQGSQVITPTAAGTYTYALTCGGVESGFASLRVGAGKVPLSFEDWVIPSVIALGSGGTATLNAEAVTYPYYFPATGTVTFSSGDVALGSAHFSNNLASVNVTVPNLPLGTYNVTANYSGDSNYAASSATYPFTVEGYATTVSLAAYPLTIAQGQSTTLSTSVMRSSNSGIPTGTVSFYYDSALLGSVKLVDGKATFVASTSGSITPNEYPVDAIYNGDSLDQSSGSANIVEVVILAATSTALAVSANPVEANSSVTFTVTVKQTYGDWTPSGKVKFSAAGRTLGTATLDNAGQATMRLSDAGIAAGTYPVTANYEGDTFDFESNATINVTIE